MREIILLVPNRKMLTKSTNDKGHRGDILLKGTISFFRTRIFKNGILLSKLVLPTVRKKNSSVRENLLKFEAEGREFSKILRSLEQFIQTAKGQNNF